MCNHYYSRKSEKICFLRQDPGGQMQFLQGASLSWKRAKQKFWGQQVLFGTKFLKFGNPVGLLL